jgi:hypothetical protein
VGAIDSEALSEADVEVLLEILRDVGALVAVVDSKEPEVFRPAFREILGT